MIAPAHPIAATFAVVTLALSVPARSGPQLDERRVPEPIPQACEKLGRSGDADTGLPHRKAMALKQACDAADIRAKFAALDRDHDGYLIPEELPPDHELSRRFEMVDFDVDNRLSLAEVIEHDAETDPVEKP